MKKTLLLALALTSSLHAAQTLQFASTTANFTNLQNSAGNASSTLVWGIIVSTDNSTFAGIDPLTPYDFSGLTVSDTILQGQALTISNGMATDDRLYISTNLMTTGGSGDGSAGLSKPTNFIMNYGSGSTAGDAFSLVWFDFTTKTGQAITMGSNYGMLSLPLFVLPADSGSATSFATLGTAGLDPVRTASLEFGVPVPEASTSLLGAIGALALLRRRRN